ncbi:hypothetical protein [Kingella oralis]|jgi:hypothetical protein|nr:hypothetical protein [Kingella oralis]
MSWALCKVWNVFSGCLWQTRELNPVYILAHQRQPENDKTHQQRNGASAARRQSGNPRSLIHHAIGQQAAIP